MSPEARAPAYSRASVEENPHGLLRKHGGGEA
jgi:hypothetical protein